VIDVAGYKSSKKNQIGGTMFRKGHISAAQNAARRGVDTDTFLDSNLENSATIRHSNYIDHNARRRIIPSNAAHVTVDPDVSAAFLQKTPSGAMFDREEYRDQSKERLLLSLRGAKEFVKHGGKCLYSVKIPCPLIGCSASFYLPGDLMAHLREKCDYREKGAISCGCGKFTCEGGRTCRQASALRARYMTELPSLPFSAFLIFASPISKFSAFFLHPPPPETT